MISLSTLTTMGGSFQRREITEQKKCIYCCFKERLLNFNELRPGHHITIAGETLSINVGHNLYSIHTHHAIVKSCQIIHKRAANVTLLQVYSTPYDKTLRPRETTEHFNLFHHEIHIVRYRHFSYDNDEILRRAEAKVSDSKKSPPNYSLLFSNCEHFCHDCCVGNKKSNQVENFFRFLKDTKLSLGSTVGKIVKFLFKIFLYSIDDIYEMTKGLRFLLKVCPCLVLLASILVIFLYTIYRHNKLSKSLRKGKICLSCCRRLKEDNWITFCLILGLQLGGYVLVSFVMVAIGSWGTAALLVALGLLTIAATCQIPKLLRKFFSPFDGEHIPVKDTKYLKKGDAVSISRCKLSTTGIVSSVKAQDSKSATISVIHYSTYNFLATRTVVETEINVNLEKNEICCHDYSTYQTHSPEIVVQRAKMRIGEQKFRLLSNRSCHLSHWAKIKIDKSDDEDDEHANDIAIDFRRSLGFKESCSQMRQLHVGHRRKRKHACKLLGSQWVKTRDEITEGQIVSIKNGWFSNKAISTEVVYDEQCLSKLYLTVIHYNEAKTICEETFLFDLRYDDIWVDLVHPVNSFSKKDIIRRARARVGEPSNRKLVSCRSLANDLANEIAIKSHYDQLVDLDTLKSGDAIRFSNKAPLHDCIVDSVEIFDSKTNNTGNITIIHYASDTVFGTRTVRKETLNVNLLHDIVQVLKFEGYITYPRERVVQRARSRIGEQRYNFFGNNSSDLVHWSKVVQTPAIVSIGQTDEQIVLPEVGKACENFQIVEAQAWCDLKLGEIVEYRYYLIPHQGILSNIDSEKEEIKVIHYGTQHLFATRTIMEDTLALNLKTHTLRIYRADPAKRHTLKKALELARERIGEQRWTFRNRSWHFCLSCVLKPEAKDA